MDLDIENENFRVRENEKIKPLRPRRFDNIVKRVPKLRFEPVLLLFLVRFEMLWETLCKMCDVVKIL